MYIRAYLCEMRAMLSHSRELKRSEQAVWPHLAIPAQRQVFGVVDDLVVFIFALALTQLLFLFLFALLSCPRLLPLHVLMGELPLLLHRTHRAQQVSPSQSGRARSRALKLMRKTHPQDLHILVDLSLQEGRFPVPLRVSEGVTHGDGYILPRHTTGSTVILICSHTS